jgi:predicted NUDIX family NTP pyrophosphohydrolase
MTEKEMVSSGIIPVRKNENGKLEYLLGKIGGPYGRGIRSFSMIKGVVNDGEDLRLAAIREFEEETGYKFPITSKLVDFGSYRTTHKINKVFFCITDIENKFKFEQHMIEFEYPKGSGKIISVPEIEYIKYMTLEEAMIKCKSNSFVTLLNALEEYISVVSIKTFFI